MPIPKGRKLHYHYAVAYRTSTERTQKGNPRNYFFTLDCGHIHLEFHSARTSVSTFMLSVMLPDKIRKKGVITKEDFPRYHCHKCASGEPHTEDATDLDKLIGEINSKIAKTKCVLFG